VSRVKSRRNSFNAGLAILYPHRISFDLSIANMADTQLLLQYEPIWAAARRNFSGHEDCLIEL
jgi:hypothetical protein